MDAILHRLQHLRRDRGGAVTVLLAGSLLMLMGAATVSVDLGSIYLAQRKLQGIADAAAMAAAQETALTLRRSAAQGVITQSQEADVEVASLENGTYRQDKAIPVAQRFQTGGDESAARIRLVQTVPLFFGRALGFKDATVTAQATAARLDMASYSLGSSLATVSDGIPNALLSSLIGTQLNLSVLDTQSLVNAQVDLLGFADALKAQVGAKNIAYAELFDTPLPLGDALRAIASTVADTQTVAVIDRIAATAPLVDVKLADVLDLGPYGRLDYNPGTKTVGIDAFSLIRTLLELSHDDTLDLQFDLAVSGLSNVHVRLVRGYGMEHSPWLTITGARDYVLRTAQARLLVSTRAGTGNPLLPSIEVPIYIDLAEAEATLDDIQCSGSPDTDGVTLGVTPALGNVGIGTPNATDMGDLSKTITLSRATLINVPLLAKVTALSQVSLGGTTGPQQVLFSFDDVQKQVTKTVSVHDLTQSLATSLIAQTDLQAQALGLTLSLSSITKIVGNTLGVIAPTLDKTVFSLTDALGVRVGAAQVRVNKVRCGVPTIIA
ncbi:hypothetical protein HT136_23270 [Novosphingobium profundi]|uniref:pilus assembly protein TadG-related protein n=1 Tax=Novosphingobium profundi TaxID=1774954 RepID=UPI001BDA7479|nr:pilus assembly protein TadG-related protein [Novosphingobium profundi]MBT0671296.1 hypothetical protein [Novosphingobium profundi]